MITEFKIAVSITLVSFLAVAFQPTAFAGEPETRLRFSAPKGTFRTYQGGAIRLTKVQVDVRNAGEVSARDVSVQVELPDGTSVTAYGDNELKAKSKSTYIAHPNEYVVTNKKLKATVNCSNCYR